MRDIGHVYRGFFVDNATRVRLGGPGMAFHHIHTLNQQTRVLREHFENITLFPLVLTGDNDDVIALSELFDRI